MNEKSLRSLEYNKIIQRLLKHCTSEEGRAIVKSLKPSRDYSKIDYLLNETSEAVSIILRNGEIPIAGFHNLNNILKKAKINSMLTLKELLNISSTLRVVSQVINYFDYEGKKENEYIIIQSIIDGLDKITFLEKEISRCIISEEELSDNASNELFQIRRQISKKNQSIREKLNSFISSTSYQKYLQEQIITLRQERYVIPVKQEYRGNVPGLIHDQSSSGATLFIEPIAIVEMNNDLKKLKLEEEQEIERILMNFTRIISDNYDTLINNYKLLVTLDVIFAKAKYALELDAKRPFLNNMGKIYLKKARHPLIDKNEVVPSDIYIGEKFTTLIITGPNTGGKTVTLKTLGLLCLMMQSGLFVPVNDGSEMCVFSNIFADIGDEQSIEQSLSTFSGHMTNIVDILGNFDNNSLILFDELGAGTDPTEGAALAMSILDLLHQMEVTTIATTHYSELKEYALTTEGVENASVEFDVETLRPTYKLLIGIPGKSNAFEISKRLGLSDHIINNSKKYLSKDNVRFEDVLRDIDIKRKEIESDYVETKKLKQEYQERLEELDSEKNDLQQEKKMLLKKAKEEALEIINTANDEVSEVIKSVREIQSSNNQNINKDLEAYRRELKSKGKNIEDELYEKSKDVKVELNVKLEKGDHVLLKDINQKGYIIEPPNTEGIAVVEVGIMKLKIQKNNLTLIREEVKEKKSYSKNKVKSKALQIKANLDIRGMTTEESIMDVEKYIDDAYLANLKVVTIIHGKGTGALRKAVHVSLKKNPHVDNFRIGNYNEGGTGATIVEVK